MTDPMTGLDAYTDEELEQALARVLLHARRELLNDAEVQKFWQLHQEILRRRAPHGPPRSLTDSVPDFALKMEGSGANC